MGWKKKGLLFGAKDVVGFHTSHTTAPCVLADGDRIRVFYSGRDGRGRSFVSWVDLDASGEVPKPAGQAGVRVLESGEPGAFDDRGAMASWAVPVADGCRLYYTGWNTGSEVPFRLSIGLATGEGRGDALRRWSTGPLLDRDQVDPILLASPCVLRHDGRWKMWYVSGVAWKETESGLRHYYHIRYASSDDGVRWDRDGHVCLDFANAEEYALSRPCVVIADGRYHMWFSYRASQASRCYRIGYAVSDDGLQWSRDDDRAGLHEGDYPWEIDMVCYGCVFDHRGRRWMLYNGDGYGETGIGLALWEDDDQDQTELR